ncbi:MAG: tRNA (adenosine(37)-N6)-threonylcarbamoyltransferase complex dimerization subunit type 1 TsaB [Eubacterium sp.]|nr:tRNA (adenosine(37)-N6)-threonylcarbamoyltransferase complex dimerization subunit type 1 TsaB [Eubacterium sp.]
MKVLGIDSSGMTATVALIEDDKLIAEFTVNNKRTHSETLMPMIDKVLTASETDIRDVELLAIAAGPGSFTGLRIGAATVKGLGMSLDVPVAAIPTCEGLAMNLSGTDRLVCPLMDARRNQVYTGLYRVSGDMPEAVIEQTACDISEIVDKVNEAGEKVIFLGDGVAIFKEYIESNIRVEFSFANANASLQRGASIASLGLLYQKAGKTVSVDEFTPVYLRPSQAERVREEKNA